MRPCFLMRSSTKCLSQNNLEALDEERIWFRVAQFPIGERPRFWLVPTFDN